MSTVLGNYINGAQTPCGEGIQQDVFNPATGEVAAKVALSTVEEVHAAIEAAQTAFPEVGGDASIGAGETDESAQRFNRAKCR